jgi:hypothetical protein
MAAASFNDKDGSSDRCTSRPHPDLFESGEDSAPEQCRWLNHVIDRMIVDFLGTQTIQDKVVAACTMDMAQLREKGITMFDYVKACGSASSSLLALLISLGAMERFWLRPYMPCCRFGSPLPCQYACSFARRSWSLTQGIARRTWTTSSSRPTAARAQCTPRYVRDPGPAIRGCLLRIITTHF